MSRIPYINTMETTMQKALHYVQCYHLLHPDAGAADVAAEIVEHLTGCPTPRAADGSAALPDCLSDATGIIPHIESGGTLRCH